MHSSKLPSLSARFELRSFGEDIAIARKRRSLTQAHLAAAAGITVPTLRKLERGEPGVSIGAMAMVLLALGVVGGLSCILPPEKDVIGQAITIGSLPARVRTRKLPASNMPSDSQGLGKAVEGGLVAF